MEAMRTIVFRADIERKKEDLRTMVGERYRDLIEAADTIAEMKNSAEKVMSTIGRIETLCTELKHNQMVKSSSHQQKKKQEIEIRRKEEAKFHEVASQIKLLLDIPEKMWTCLDCEDYLSASRLYLLAQHINTSLQLTSQNAPNFLYWFPVLNRQWAAISHFKITILQGCRRLIKETTVSDQKIADSLCSILLLENSNPRQVFNEFLLARTEKQRSPGVMPQECTNLLLRTLTKVTTQKQHESGLLDLHSSVSARCLPTSVTDFCPSHKSVSLGVSQQHLHDNCTQWIQTCINDVKSGVTTLLNFVNTVKHLASIRDTVWELMSQDMSLKDWTVVCESVLSNSLHIWDDLLRPLFVDRVKALIKYQLEATVEITERQMNKVIVELDDENSSRLCVDTDLAGYIWSESPGDIAANTAWGMAGSRSLLESGGLMMKAKAYTPIVQTFCKTFDEKLDAVSEDYKFYIFTDAETMSVAMETTPFNRFSDSTSLLTFVQTSCMECVQGILEFLTKLLDDCRADLSSSKLRCSNIGNKLLLSGRLCAAMCDLTPHLQQCMMGSEQVSRMDRSLLKRSTSGRHVIGKQESNVIWENIKSQLIKYQQTAFR
ncbi:conserved oligomeric Golgi complex subunit 1-like [Ruditapes philippinarum]|uniref:conserved oligomeric Golgi complex subunit 1-like n=1 Tax=Ruditapes philippinarum TaxID=129788 RepID=UPI00295AD71A|nr:conserved oligomeric Golgi complex subunit 1-like [Ruditapes philippinarum]